jgi:hypothetical protein
MLHTWEGTPVSNQALSLPRATGTYMKWSERTANGAYSSEVESPGDIYSTTRAFLLRVLRSVSTRPKEALGVQTDGKMHDQVKYLVQKKTENGDAVRTKGQCV